MEIYILYITRSQLKVLIYQLLLQDRYTLRRVLS